MHSTRREEAPRVVKVVKDQDIRRFVLEQSTFECLADSVQRSFGVKARECAIRYQDEDGDTLTISSDPELEEAFRVAKRQAKTLRLFIADAGEDYELIASRTIAAAPSKPATPSASVEPSPKPEEKKHEETMPVTKIYPIGPVYPVLGAAPVPTSTVQSVHVAAKTPVQAQITEKKDSPSKPEPSKPLANSDKCNRQTCLYVKHSRKGNNGGTHCCMSCKRNGRHGGACTRIVVGTPEKKKKKKVDKKVACSPPPLATVVAAPVAEVATSAAPASSPCKQRCVSTWFCDGCSVKITGIRYHCFVCPGLVLFVLVPVPAPAFVYSSSSFPYMCYFFSDYDLCEKCKANPMASNASKHPLDHAMWKLPVDSAEKLEKVPDCERQQQQQQQKCHQHSAKSCWRQRTEEWKKRKSGE